MERNRQRDLQKNIVVGLLVQVLSLAVNLISKSAIRSYLDIEYLGLQSVFANFCDIFVFGFAGLGTAMQFRMYRAFAKQDETRIRELYHHFDRIYQKITWLVSAVGGVCAIFVLLTINADISDLEVLLTYLLYLISIIITNRFLVRSYFIMADERRYVVSAINGAVDVAALAVQILVLKFTRNYALFLLCILVKNVIINLVIKRYLHRKYPVVKGTAGEIQDSEKKEIVSNIKDLMVSKLGAVLVRSTDSILTSSLINTALAGIYSNYQFIITGVLSLLQTFFQAITARIGHIMNHDDSAKKEKSLFYSTAANIWITGFTLVCFVLLVQDFVTLWMGKDALLSKALVCLIAVNYYLDSIRESTNTFRNILGLFHKIKRAVLLKGLINLILSIILGKLYGLGGIVAATGISQLVTLFWYEPYLVYRYFKKSVWAEVFYQLRALLAIAVCLAVSYFATQWLTVTGWGMLVIKALLCAAVSNLVLALMIGLLFGVKKFIPEKYQNRNKGSK